MPEPLEFTKQCVVECGDCPEHIYEQILPALEAALWAVPGWVEDVRVSFDLSHDGNFQTRCQEEYRVIYLIVGNGLATLPRRDWERWITHEFLHAHLEEIDDFWRHLVDATDPPEALRTWAQKRWRRAMEIAVNDLERTFWNRQEALQKKRRRLRA